MVVESRPAETDPEAGERLYGWNCLPCHGPEGHGDGPEAVRRGIRPRDLTRGSFILKTSSTDEAPFDDDLYRTIAAGIPPAGMPAHRQFTGEDLWTVVDYVKALSPEHFARRPARTRIEPPQGAVDPDRGAKLFDTTQCAVCHGPGAKVEFPAPDLTRGAVAFKAGSGVGDVYRILTAGMPGTPMPAFPSLTDVDRRDLAAHVVSTFQPIPPGERLYLERGCSSCHTIGRGRLVGPDLAGVGTRRTRDWLRRWLESPSAMIRQDDEARRLRAEYPVEMPAPGLSEAELTALLDYLSPPEKK